MAPVRDDAPPDTATLRPEDPIDELESALQALFRRLKQARLHEYLLRRAGVELDRAGGALLYALYEEPSSLRITELAERLHVDIPAVSRKARQLERAGLIERGPDQADGRAIRLHLTPAGRGRTEAILAARRAWLEAVLIDWPEADRAELAHLLSRFAGAVGRELEESDG
ncbi:MarR family winged helix-turn-helix transcriptional regulator [Actinospica sp.]|jgi:DNA-binding MarR family transcriptional regulator|uniref:MarR family winged helix-turn-helix transcriptional regulator n=1 Tax=Actinospica sp. TaxID=1872142 RepID=UPI002CE67777|nr:MarR family transcriptional regulator [Actinospica sp.]HWG28063.1 MarR family transcriptional regulator [Actinospica sp.]